VCHGTDALAAAVAIRDWVRQNLAGASLHLVLETSGPFALLLGHMWDRVPQTTIYEDLAPGYELAFAFLTEARRRNLFTITTHPEMRHGRKSRASGVTTRIMLGAIGTSPQESVGLAGYETVVD
jgi:hypothetical protein